MRRKDREMPEAFALSVMDKCIWATLATVNEDGMPYCMPISIVREGRTVYFHCAHDGHKIENLRRNPAICLSCVGDTHAVPKEFTTEFESAVATGQAVEVIQDEEKIHGLRLLCLRHAAENMEGFDNAIAKSLGRTAVWKIELETVTGKRKKYGSDGKELKFGKTE